MNIPESHELVMDTSHPISLLGYVIFSFLQKKLQPDESEDSAVKRRKPIYTTTRTIQIEGGGMAVYITFSGYKVVVSCAYKEYDAGLKGSLSSLIHLVNGDIFMPFLKGKIKLHKKIWLLLPMMSLLK